MYVYLCVVYRNLNVCLVAYALHAVASTLLERKEVVLCRGTAGVVEALTVARLGIVGVAQLPSATQARRLGLFAGSRGR